MRVTIDQKKCSGYASCMIIVPEVFDLHDDDNLAYVIDEHPAEELRPKLEKAVRNCPTRAIVIEP